MGRSASKITEKQRAYSGAIVNFCKNYALSATAHKSSLKNKCNKLRNIFADKDDIDRALDNGDDSALVLFEDDIEFQYEAGDDATGLQMIKTFKKDQ